MASYTIRLIGTNLLQRRIFMSKYLVEIVKCTYFMECVLLSLVKDIRPGKNICEKNL